MEAKIRRSAAISNQLGQWLPIALVLLLASGLYLYQIGTESLWIDESFSILDAQQLDKTLGFDGSLNPRPLYYIVLRFWMIFGTSEAWLRGLAALFGLGSVFLTYLLGKRIAGKSVGLVAALLLALSPLFINHAQEVRMYTLGTFLGLWGTLSLTYVLERPTTSPTVGWATSRLLMLLAAPLNFTLLAPDVVLLLLRFRDQRQILIRFTKLFLLIGIFWLPFALSLASKTPSFMSAWVAEIESPGIIDAGVLLLRDLTADPMRIISSPVTKLFQIIYILLLACLLGIAIIFKRNSTKFFWIAMWAALPAAMLFFVSHISSSLWIKKYLLFLAPYVLILLSIGFVRLWSWKHTAASLVAVIYLITVGSSLFYYYELQGNQDWRGASQIVSSNERSNDVIVLAASSYRPHPAWNYYYHGSNSVQTLYDLFPRAKFSKETSVEQAPVDILSNLPHFESRLWLVCGSCSQRQIQILQSAVRTQDELHIQKHEKLKDIDLFLFTSNSASLD